MNRESKKYTILYAEDDNIIRSGYEEYLKNYFKEVFIAKDGKEAWELYNKHDVDIMLLDIKMPYLSGLEVATMVRQIEKNTKIIILTAFMDEQKLLKAVELYLTKYLQKPVRREELEKTLNKAVFELENDARIDEIFYITDSCIFDRVTRSLMHDGESVILTKNEILLIELLSSKSEKVFSSEEIVDFFWTDEKNLELSLDGLRGLLKRLRKKMPSNSIVNIASRGYYLKNIKNDK
ncbi:MAG: response regulator transcription factor [Campylobacterota bacterium]|nr:response regulator transcription factor [Campylobacterota bacterium]